MKGSFKTFMVLLFLSFSFLFSQEASQTRVFIFVIDQSGSMRRGNLCQRVVEDIRDFITNSERSGIRLGDRLIIIGFGDDVRYHFDEELRGTQDIERAISEIERMKFADRYTHMSKAFDILSKRINELHRAYPSPKYVYIYTDGINEPPPEAKESPLAFTEILRRYWQYEILRERDIYLCLITFGIEIPSEIKEVLPQSERVIYREEASVPPQEERITPGPSQLTPESVSQPVPESVPQSKPVLPPQPSISPKKPVPLWILLPLLVILIGVIFAFVMKGISPKETFPEDYVLLEIDEEGREGREIHLSEYGRNVSPKNLDIKELTPDAFSIFIKEGSVYLKRGKKGEELEVTIDSENKKLKEGESVPLLPDTIFKCGSKYFKFVKKNI
ncbi:MAG: vWA domain-containing protein [candidate division WOR-3 bacterium]